MKEFNLKWFGKINDIKSFRVKTHNILLIEFAKCDLQKTIELFKKDVSKFGIFITICSCGPNKTIYTTDSNNVWLEVAKTH